MKQGTVVTRVVVIVLFCAVAAYIGFTVWQGMTDPYQMVATYAYEMDDGAPLEGLVVREEQVIQGESALAQVLPQEGERVRAGAAVAAIYQSEGALQSYRETQKLELRLEQLNYAMRRSDTVGDAKELDEKLVDTLGTLKGELSAGDLGELEDTGLALRSLVVKRSGNQTTSTESLAALQAAAGEAESQLAALRAATAQQTRFVTVSRSGTFSGLADGLETVLTPQALETLTVGELEDLADRPAQSPTGAVGKLITSSTWYYVTTVGDATAQRLSEGMQYLLSFTGDFREELNMRLERLGAPENGRRVAVFSTSRHLDRVTLARHESATLVFHRYSGVRVPDQALRVRENEDGTTTLGVYTLVGRQAEFKPVEIVREGDGFYLLKGTATNRKVLRAGDVLVLSNEPLYDGKVVA